MAAVAQPINLHLHTQDPLHHRILLPITAPQLPHIQVLHIRVQGTLILDQAMDHHLIPLNIVVVAVQATRELKEAHTIIVNMVQLVTTMALITMEDTIITTMEATTVGSTIITQVPQVEDGSQESSFSS